MFLHDLIIQSCYFSLPSLEVWWRTNCPVEPELTHTDSVEKQPAPVFLADGDVPISNPNLVVCLEHNVVLQALFHRM